MPRVLAFAIFAAASVFASAFATAGGLADWPADWLLAGEIIMVPQPGSGKTPGKSPSSSEQRDRAKAYQKDQASGTPTIIVVPEEESEGALSPRGSAPEGRARENRSRAGDYQRGTDSSLHPGMVKPEAGILLDGGTTQERAHDNRSRASGYSRGESQSGIAGRIGPDGIPLVVCKDRDNVAGQIGDDLKSGSVIVILRDGKQVKVRCQ
ncbi:MAG: hypothetical protein NTY41_08200 [Proteobacteria bacterium]|nr:hypothetical protein [Pseudomonadota bacterium]